MATKRPPSKVLHAALAPCLLALGAAGCLGIERTPKQDGGVTDTGLPDVTYDAPTLSPCAQNCIDKTPGGRALFTDVAACNQGSRSGTCADACSADASADAASPTCSVPGVLDPAPSCNACIKDTCCAFLRACLGVPDCLTVALCAATCSQ